MNNFIRLLFKGKDYALVISEETFVLAIKKELRGDSFFQAIKKAINIVLQESKPVTDKNIRAALKKI